MTHYSISDGIAVISMDDSKANALNPDMLQSISGALDQAEQDRSRLVVLKGRPGIFSAGLDLKLMPTLSAVEKKKVLTLFGETACRLFMSSIFNVAVVTGHAIAGGAILAYACDRRFKIGGQVYV